jgi:arsenite methyltransferase
MTTMTSDAKFWDNLAEKYAAKPVDDVAAFERKKAITRQLLRSDATVLEIGCGTGSLALALAASAGHIHAMDISGEMVRIANQKKAAQGVTNVTFHKGTLDAGAPVAPGSLDCVWAFSILHLVDDRAETLRTSFELLKPGGVLVSSNVCLGGTWVPYGALITVMRWFGKAPMVHTYDRVTIVRDLEAAGFVEIEEKDVGADSRVAFIVAKKPS